MIRLSRFIRGLIVILILIPLPRFCWAETIAELEGHSVEINLTIVGTYRGIDPPYVTRGPFYQRLIVRLYIGTKGRIFNASQLVGPGASSRWNTITRYERAAPSRYDERLQTWTMKEGRLVGVSQLPEGFRIGTYTINLSNGTCSYEERFEKSPNGLRIVVRSDFDGALLEVVSRKIESQDCRVIEGNIFKQSAK